MKYGSLFSGIGGFDRGFDQAGLSCLWQVEIDTDCNRVLEKHWPGVTRYKDVRDVGKLEPVDVICGGFPCQDLSVAGKRAGLAGERSGLWFEFLRIVELNRPRWLVIENVPGLLSSWSPVEPPPDAVEGREWDVEENSDFEIILAGLTELGYSVAGRILDAQYDGVAQRRERVFIVGSLGDGSCAEILFESESVSWNPPTRGEAGQRVAATVTPRIDSNSRGWSPVNEADNLIAATLDQRGRGPTDSVMNLQVIKEHQDGTTNCLPGVLRDSYQEEVSQAGELSMPGLRVQAFGGNDTRGPIEIATACNAHGGTGRHDFESETLIALRSEDADAGEDGTGRGTPLVVAAHDTGQGWWNQSDVAGTLRAEGENRPSRPSNIIANCFNEYTGGADDNDAQANHVISVGLGSDPLYAHDLAQPITNRNGDPGVIAFPSKDHGADGGQRAIAFAENQRGELRTSDVSPQLSCAGGKPGSGYPAVAFTERTRSEGRTFEAQEELAYAITNPGSGGRTHSRQVAGQFGVRRLTPTECMRLQGFPDWWFDDDNGKKLLSDSAMYRCLGNAVAVPVAKWIGQRIRLIAERTS